MEYKKKSVQLKDGKTCIVRSPKECDAKAILDHLIKTSDETGFMLRYGEEVTMTMNQEKEYLKKELESPYDILICAEIDGKIVANAGFQQIASFIKCKHRANFGISIQKEYWNMGIGSIILPAIIESAKQAGYEQIELEVVEENERAYHLYEKYGFVQYGKRTRAFKYKDGSYSNEYLMMLEL